MPGKDSYGTAGKWVHNRAHRLMAESEVPKHIAYAIATQQGHKIGKTPKGHRTREGVMEAKQKYTAPKSEYQKTAMIAGFLDEMDKIAFDAATAMEAFGVPGALWEGHHKGGLKGMATTGLGAVGGLGAGMLASHYVKKLTGGQWGTNHPILKTIADAAPIGMGGVLGGALGGHYTKKIGHVTKEASLATELLLKSVKNAPIAIHEKKNIERLPERIERVEYALRNNVPMGLVPMP